MSLYLRFSLACIAVLSIGLASIGDELLAQSPVQPESDVVKHYHPATGKLHFLDFGF